MKVYWLISTLIVSHFSLMAEGEDTSVWKKFELIESKSALNTGSVKINLSTNQDRSMADVLNRNSALFVKYYSPGSLASTSMRGMGAQHTAVMWNGINLQSSMNSNFDLNLLPAFFIDQAAIETGANAASCGNGAIGGAIVLSNDLNKGNRVYAEMGYGSFAQKNLGVGFSFHHKKLTSNTRFLYRYADNDYEFVNYFKPEKPTEKIQNNRFDQKGLMQEFSYKLNSKHSFYSNLWYVQTNRQLPVVMGASLVANERQDDVNTLFLIRHEYSSLKKNTLNTKLAYMEEKIDYYNDLLEPAYNTAKTLIAESELKYRLSKNFEWFSSLNQTYQKAFTDGYRQGSDRQMLSLYTKISWSTIQPELLISIGNRQLLADGKMAPSTPEFGFDYQVLKSLKLKGNVAYSFRLPSFNDLYWQPGGNKELDPEKGKKAELSVEHKNKFLKIGATVFMHHIQNWIMWMPDQGSFNWKAINAKEVESKGVELALDAKWALHKNHFIRLFGRYQYVQSINTDVYAEDKSSLGKQLFYTPLHTGFANFHYIFGKNKLKLAATYTGSRFSSSDNHLDNLLPAYVLYEAAISRDLNFKKHHATLELSVLNLLNSSYQVFENRPMPLRNYQITFKFNINYE